ncbi:unnamed protein product, partial [Didymodactylos carnosus]
MVLWYGFFAIETAQTNRCDQSQHNHKCLTNDNIRNKNNISESTMSSRNSWIYTEDLKKRFELRYFTLDDLKSTSNYQYVIVPIYCEKSSTKSKLSTTTTGENSWIYTKSFREYLFGKQHLFNSRSSLLSLIGTNHSTIDHYRTNHAYTDDTDDSYLTKVKQNSSSLVRMSKSNLFCRKMKKLIMQSKTLTANLVEEEDEDKANTDTVAFPLIKDSSLPATMSHSPLLTPKQSTKLTRLSKLFFKST